jgi:glycosyltransferase involved in cell wall biosynthesis
MSERSEAARLLAQADRRRDAGDWAGAAAGYAAYLAEVPDDWAIWIQHGHCVKEAGDPLGALASYRKAQRGLPEDADLPLQMGHALKRAGDVEAARAMYLRALEMDPAADGPWVELMRLPPRPVAEDAGGLALLSDLRVVLDLSDLWAWWQRARVPTGIQRVQIGIALAATRAGAAAAEARLAVFRPETLSWRAMSREMLLRLSGLARIGADASEPVWTAALAEARAALDAADDIVFAEGTWLVNPGTAWTQPGYHLAIRAARAGRALRYAALIHDCGPVVAPEHVAPATSAAYARWFAELHAEADLVLAVSDATRRDIESLRDGLRAPPIALLPLDAAPTPPPRPRAHPRAAEIAKQPYVLCLGTIESRKDHLFLLNAWLALIRRLGDAAPLLLLVGRAGFGGEPALSLLRRAPALAERAVWLDDVADGALPALIKGALFTVTTSRHEGWGLPVTEALAHGRIAVAPAQSGLLEAGQGLALHYAPGSEPDFLGVVERLLAEPDVRAAQEARIAAELRLRSWAGIADALLAALPDVPPVAAPPPPPLGVTHALTALDAPRPLPGMLWADRLRAGANWHAAEDWGCWTKPGRALLRLPLPEGTTGPLRVSLALRGAATPQRVSLRAGRGERVALEVAAEARPVAVLDLPMAGDAVEITIEAAAARDAEGREVGIGIVALMACAPAEVTARLEFLERLAFVFPEPA